MRYAYYILVSDGIALSCSVWFIATFTINKHLITILLFSLTINVARVTGPRFLQRGSIIHEWQNSVLNGLVPFAQLSLFSGRSSVALVIMPE